MHADVREASSAHTRLAGKSSRFHVMIGVAVAPSAAASLYRSSGSGRALFMSRRVRADELQDRSGQSPTRLSKHSSRMRPGRLCLVRAGDSQAYQEIPESGRTEDVRVEHGDRDGHVPVEPGELGLVGQRVGSNCGPFWPSEAACVVKTPSVVRTK